MEQNNTLYAMEMKDLVTNHREDIERILQEFFAALKKDLQEGDVNNG